MSGEFTYFRKYIILKSDYTNIEGIKPKGHGKLEVKGVKGTIALNLTNCKPYDDYRVYFLRNINSWVKECDLGRMIIDERGRTRTNIEFNARDLEAKGFPIDGVDAIIIRKEEKVLLSGYMDKDNGTVDKFIEQLIRDKDIEEAPIADTAQEVDMAQELQGDDLGRDMVEDLPLEELAEELPSVDLTDEMGYDFETGKPGECMEAEEDIEPEGYIEAEEDIEPEGYIEAEEDIELEEEAEAEKGVESEKHMKSQGIQQAESEEIPGEVEDSTEDVALGYQSLEYMRQLNHKSQMTDYILSILRFFPYVDPFKLYLHGYSWWKIEDCSTDLNRGFLPYYNYLMGTDYRCGVVNNSVSCMDLIKRYDHYIFGMYKERKEVKYYLYGVPGKFTMDEHPFKGVTGFNTWYEREDGLGYWILYIDPMTGRVVRIINPMIPEY